MEKETSKIFWIVIILICLTVVIGIGWQTLGIGKKTVNTGTDDVVHAVEQFESLTEIDETVEYENDKSEIVESTESEE